MKSRQNQGEAFLSKAAKESTQRLYSKPKTVCIRWCWCCCCFVFGRRWSVKREVKHHLYDKRLLLFPKTTDEKIISLKTNLYTLKAANVKYINGGKLSWSRVISVVCHCMVLNRYISHRAFCFYGWRETAVWCLTFAVWGLILSLLYHSVGTLNHRDFSRYFRKSTAERSMFAFLR